MQELACFCTATNQLSCFPEKPCAKQSLALDCLAGCATAQILFIQIQRFCPHTSPGVARCPCTESALPESPAAEVSNQQRAVGQADQALHAVTEQRFAGRAISKARPFAAGASQCGHSGRLAAGWCQDKAADAGVATVHDSQHAVRHKAQAPGPVEKRPGGGSVAEPCSIVAAGQELPGACSRKAAAVKMLQAQPGWGRRERWVCEISMQIAATGRPAPGHVLACDSVPTSNDMPRSVGGIDCRAR